MIQAKPVIPDQYWILRQDDRKVGNIQAQDHGYQVTILGRQLTVPDLKVLSEAMPIDFRDMPQVTPDPGPTWEVHGYPTTALAHNAIWDVRHQLPLWTREPSSRSWITAGWYNVQQNRRWRTVLCPKLILLQRYAYRGPWRTAEEARAG